MQSQISSNFQISPHPFNKEDWASSYCNVEKELTKIELKVIKGKVPQSLKGTFYRNGPGRLERNNQWVHHPFDGDGMISAMEFKKGIVSFTNKFVRTKEWEKEEKAGKFLYRGVFGTQKAGGVLNNAFDTRLKNIANTNVVKLGGELLALWEASSPHSLDPENLRTIGISTLKNTLKKGEAFSAHPRFDPGHNGKEPKMVTFGVTTGPKSTIRLMEFATTGKNAGNLISERKDNFNGFAFLHDFAITPNWAIFLQNSIQFNPLPFLLGQKGAAQCISSNPKGKAKYWIIPRDSGSFSKQKPQIFDAPDGFVFHHLNAWEDNNEIILESIFYDDFPSIKPNENFREIDFSTIPEGILKRCRLNLSNKTFEIQSLSNQCCEFAMVNPIKIGLSARYAWMATAQQPKGNAPLQCIKKLDLVSGKEVIWSAGPRGFVSEPLMVPDKSSSIEDNGWILVLIWNGARKANDLIVLKANDLSEEAVLEVPLAIPHGLHGSWADAN